MAVLDAGRAVLVCVRPSNGDDEFWSAFAATSVAELLQAQRVQ